MKRTLFAPQNGVVYENHGGGKFVCLDRNASSRSARMQNIESGWMLVAHGCGMYEDGTMDWDYSTQLGFYPVEAKYGKTV